METTKHGNTVKLVLPFPHFCGYLPTNLRSSKEKQIKSIKTVRIISNIDILGGVVFIQIIMLPQINY